MVEAGIVRQSAICGSIPWDERLPHHRVWCDVRLDNRPTLLARLRLPDSDCSDEELLLAAWLKWGETCTTYLLGDFAFAIQDADRNRVFLARDPMGVRPLYYFRGSKCLLFASDIRDILKNDCVPRKIEERMLASYLLEIDQPGLTFYQHIRMVPSACSMMLTENGESAREYWSPLNCPEVRYRRVEDYEDALDDLLQQSVADRCHSPYPIAAHLSGGLDSSVVCAMAANTLAQRGETLRAWSWLPAPENAAEEQHFEWANGRRVAEQYGIDYRLIETDLKLYQRIFSSHDIRYMDKLDFWNEHVVRDAVKSSGSRVILSGWGGDELVSYNGGNSFYAELFLQGQRGQVLSEWWKRAKRGRFPPASLLKILWQQIIEPLLSEERYHSLYHAHSNSFYEGYAPFSLLHPEIEERLAAIHFPRPLPAGMFGQRAEQKGRILLGSIQARLESWAASAWDSGVEYRFPMLDKRVVEFALGIPLEQYRDGREQRRLFRRVSSRYLPHDIAFSDTKYEHARADRHNRLMYEYLSTLASGGELQDWGYVSEVRLNTAIRDLASQSLDLENIDQLIRMMVIGKALLLRRCR